MNKQPVPSNEEQEHSSLDYHHQPPLSTPCEPNKLSHNGTTQHEYSSLNHQCGQPYMDAGKVAYSTDQKYSTLQHHTVSPTTDSDKMSHTVTSDQ